MPLQKRLPDARSNEEVRRLLGKDHHHEDGRFLALRGEFRSLFLGHPEPDLDAFDNYLFAYIQFHRPHYTANPAIAQVFLF